MTRDDDWRNLLALVRESRRQADREADSHPGYGEDDWDIWFASCLSRYAASHGLLVARDDGTPL